MFSFLTLFWSWDSCCWSISKDVHFPMASFALRAFNLASGFCWHTLYIYIYGPTRGIRQRMLCEWESYRYEIVGARGARCWFDLSKVNPAAKRWWYFSAGWSCRYCCWEINSPGFFCQSQSAYLRSSHDPSTTLSVTFTYIVLQVPSSF